MDIIDISIDDDVVFVVELGIDDISMAAVFRVLV
jgi:hypothetical protein